MYTWCIIKKSNIKNHHLCYNRVLLSHDKKLRLYNFQENLNTHFSMKFMKTFTIIQQVYQKHYFFMNTEQTSKNIFTYIYLLL